MCCWFRVVCRLLFDDCCYKVFVVRCVLFVGCWLFEVCRCLVQGMFVVMCCVFLSVCPCLLLFAVCFVVGCCLSFVVCVLFVCVVMCCVVSCLV